MELDDIRLKDIEELNVDEKKFVSDNFDKLTEEEQNYYKSIKESGGEFKLNFKTQEEFDKFVSDKVQTGIEASRKERLATKKKESGKPDDNIFPEGFKANDWNEAFKVALPKIEDRIVNKIQNMTQKQRDALSKINEEFDKEFETLAFKNPGLPAKGTAEREAWEAEVADVGVKYKLHTMTDAYNVWKALNSTKDSVGSEPAVLPTEGQPMGEDKSRLVRNISRGTGTSSGAPRTKYFVGQGRRLDDMIEQRKREEGIAS